MIVSNKTLAEDILYTTEIHLVKHTEVCRTRSSLMLHWLKAAKIIITISIRKKKISHKTYIVNNVNRCFINLKKNFAVFTNKPSKMQYFLMISVNHDYFTLKKCHKAIAAAQGTKVV
jgi:hypothetical protein